MATQSWAAWLLDSYASSVAHPSAESPYRNPEDSESYTDTSSTPTKTPQTTDPPYGPHIRTGRGGAGNFQWQSNQPSLRADVESQEQPSLLERRKTAAEIERIDTSEAMKVVHSRQGSGQYVRTGRGGAGNLSLVPSPEIQQAARSPSWSHHQSPISPMLGTSMGHPGRGGAGNYAAAADLSDKLESQQETEEQQAANKRREQIEEEVGSKLQAPPDAFLGGRPKSGLFENVEGQ